MPRLTKKGQVTIPKEIREALGLRRGDEVEFVLEGGVYILRKAKRGLDSCVGYLRSRGRTTDELMRKLRGEPEP